MRKKFKALPKLKSLLLFLLLDLIFSERGTAREREIEPYHSSHPLFLFLFLDLKAL
jgi:hypothetical protein